MALARERIVLDRIGGDVPTLGQAWSREHTREPPTVDVAASTPRAKNPRATQRADLERLRRRLAEPCELKDRDLLTLLSYAVGGDGDPVVGLLEDVRATLATLADLPSGGEPDLLLSLERRVAVALELYARATADDER